MDFFAQEKNKTALELLLKEVELEQETFSEEALPLSGQSFVITGSLNHFENRSALKEKDRSPRRKGNRKRDGQNHLSDQQ